MEIETDGPQGINDLQESDGKLRHKALNAEFEEETVIRNEIDQENIPIILLEPNHKESDEIICFRNCSIAIVRTNLNDFESNEYELPIEDIINFWLCMCELPANKIFCYGNNDPINGVTFLIHPDNSIKYLEDGEPSHSSDGIYYEDNVYVFGGYSESGYSTSTRKFSLSENNWVSLESLPVSSILISSAVSNGKIVLSGQQHDMLYCYNINQNTYSELLELAEGYAKLVCAANDRFYTIVSMWNMYESELGGVDNWTQVGTDCHEFNTLISYRVTYKNSIYFVDSYYCLYKFDLKAKNVIQIKSFSSENIFY